MRLFDNSYYSSKYRRDSTFFKGVRELPVYPQLIVSFLDEFKRNVRRYSLEEKISAFSTKPEQPSLPSSSSSPSSQATSSTATTTTTTTRSMQHGNQSAGYESGTIGARRSPFPPSSSSSSTPPTTTSTNPYGTLGYNTLNASRHHSPPPSSSPTSGGGGGGKNYSYGYRSNSPTPHGNSGLNPGSGYGTLHGNSSRRGSSLVFAGGTIGASRVSSNHPSQNSPRSSLQPGQILGASRASYATGTLPSSSSSSSSTSTSTSSPTGTGMRSRPGSPRSSYATGTLRSPATAASMNNTNTDSNTLGAARSSSPRGGTLIPPGRAPPPPAAPPKPRALVLYDITLEMNDRVLECEEGEEIVIEEDCGEWLLASKNGRRGFVPYNYVQKL